MNSLVLKKTAENSAEIEKLVSGGLLIEESSGVYALTLPRFAQFVREAGRMFYT